MTHDDCTDGLLGAWMLGGSCSPNECPGVPANDDCSSPFVVSGVPEFEGELVIAGNNICATDDGPELYFEGCTDSLVGGGEMHDDVWYLYEGQPCGVLMIDSCNDADFDQMIAVYDATSGCPVELVYEVACNDDGCGSGGPASLEIYHDEGDRFLIRVGGWSDAQGRLHGPGAKTVPVLPLLRIGMLNIVGGTVWAAGGVGSGYGVDMPSSSVV